MRRALLLILLAMLWGSAEAQGIFISRYVPGNYLSDNAHLVELSNPGAARINLEGYLLVTRDYSVRLPASAAIGPGSTLRIAKKAGAGLPVDIPLSQSLDFLIRFNLLETEGNYVALLDRKGGIVDAFYYSPLPNVPFLPARDTLITFDGERISFFLPPENRDAWSYLSRSSGAQEAFEQVQGKWRTLSSAEAAPIANHEDLTVRYFEGIVTLKWATSYELGVARHLVERSLDQESFDVVGETQAIGDSQQENQYKYYDKDLVIGKVYFYRIRTEGVGKKPVYSKIKSVRVEDGLEEFEMETILVPHSDGAELNLRFISQYSQEVRIKLLDERMAEVAILFSGYVYAREPNLLKIGQRLPPGRYLVLAATETSRFGKEIVVE